MADLTLLLAGPVSVTDAQGRDHTPTSRKAKGLLALIGTAPGLRLSRVKLQGMLWSDRFSEQAAASLRQALNEIRHAFDPARDALCAGRDWVGLDDKVIKVVVEPPAARTRHDVEFAADLSVADPAFSEWLESRRDHYLSHWRRTATDLVLPSERSVVTTDPVCLVLSPARTGSDSFDRLVDVAVRAGASNAADLLPMVVRTDRGAAADSRNAVEIVSVGCIADGDMLLQVSLVHMSTGRVLSSRTFPSLEAAGAGTLRQLSGEIAVTILNAIGVPAYGNEALAGVSILDVFSFTNDRLLRADTALASLPPTHAALALRAYIRNTQYLERLSEDRRDALGDASEFAARAVELAPLSSTTLAIAAIVASQGNDTVFLGDLAERSLRANPANPLARTSQSLALAFAGRNEEAHAEALIARAQPMARLNPATWAISCAVTAIRARRFKEAERFSSLIYGYAPGCRPALRFLAALRYEGGDADGAEQALQKLRALEPDFSLDLMASHGYPVASLRAAGLMSVARSGLL